LTRRETAGVFRSRLLEVIEGSGMTRSAFANAAGMDRSTLSQLLSADSVRLPRAETIAAIARLCQVSMDWLLGLSQEGPLGPDVVSEAVGVEHGAGSPADARLRRWHAEAIGYKIRYVPATLPDLLKTEEVIRYEFRDHPVLPAENRIEDAEARLEYSRRSETDMEVCTSYQIVEEFARGEGLWRNLSRSVRMAQLEAMLDLSEELYPTFRWFMFDGLRRYSIPLTIFGPQRVAIYAGDMYLVFNSTEHIRVLTRHFDDLIRDAVVQPPDVADYLKGLRRKAAGGKAKIAQAVPKAKAASK